jgi:hypothetical protein
MMDTRMVSPATVPIQPCLGMTGMQRCMAIDGAQPDDLNAMSEHLTLVVHRPQVAHDPKERYRDHQSDDPFQVEGPRCRSRVIGRA